MSAGAVTCKCVIVELGPCVCALVLNLVCASVTLPGGKGLLGCHRVFQMGLICQAVWFLVNLLSFHP